MEAFTLWSGTLIFIALTIAKVIRAMYLNHKFQRYLQENHHEQWERIYQDQLIKKALLWPFMRGTPVDFLWKSHESFGDPRVVDFRKKIRGGMVSAIIPMAAAIAWFGIIALILDRLTRR